MLAGRTRSCPPPCTSPGPALTPPPGGRAWFNPNPPPPPKPPRTPPAPIPSPHPGPNAPPTPPVPCGRPRPRSCPSCGGPSPSCLRRRRAAGGLRDETGAAGAGSGAGGGRRGAEAALGLSAAGPCARRRCHVGPGSQGPRSCDPPAAGLRPLLRRRAAGGGV